MLDPEYLDSREASAIKIEKIDFRKQNLRASRGNFSCIGLTPRKLPDFRKLPTVQVVEHLDSRETCALAARVYPYSKVQPCFAISDEKVLLPQDAKLLKPTD